MILDTESLSFRRYEKTDYLYVEKMLNQLSILPDRGKDYLIKIHDKLSDFSNTYRFVGYIKDKIVCYGVCILDLKVRGGMCCHIEDIVVNKDMHSRGIGQKLINYLIDFANSRNCYKVTLTTQEYNREFYEKCGLTVGGIEMKKIL